MIELGTCASWDRIDDAAAIGFDYIESTLYSLSALSDEEFVEAQRKVKCAPIPIRAFNVLLPGTLKVTGEAVDEAALNAYLRPAFARAAKLGAQTIVFGSGGSRNVAGGFPMEKAWRQIARFLEILDPIAGDNGITIAIEPLRRRECNILNYVSEAVAVAAITGLPNVRVLGDTHHMLLAGEPLSALTLAGSYLKHVHVSHTLGIAPDAGRIYPAPEDGEDYAGLFTLLKEMNYQGRVSIEAGCDDFMEDGRRALDVLRAARDI